MKRFTSSSTKSLPPRGGLYGLGECLVGAMLTWAARRRIRMAMPVLALVIVSALVVPASAAPITLTDRNSKMTVDPNAQSGFSDWEVDGVDQMAQQWFWFRVGAAGPEASLDSVGAANIATIVSNGDFDPGDERLIMRFTDPLGRFEVYLDYTLTGGNAGSGTSAIAETITIVNLSQQAPLNFTLFKYSDAELLGSIADDGVSLLNPNTIEVTEGIASMETVSTPRADRTETKFFSTTRDSLNDAGPTTLDNSASLGAGDVTWAFSWTRNIPAGGDFIIRNGITFSNVPEPSSWIMLACGGVALLGIGRRRIARNRAK